MYDFLEIRASELHGCLPCKRLNWKQIKSFPGIKILDGRVLSDERKQQIKAFFENKGVQNISFQ